uniref:Uncharacterized protein n=1 Tax=Glossina pallidipes TaxID=7398 RepID=A0A1A9ZQC3_GLOPL
MHACMDACMHFRIVLIYELSYKFKITQEYFKLISPDGYNLFKLLRSFTTGGGLELGPSKSLSEALTFKLYTIHPGQFKLQDEKKISFHFKNTTQANRRDAQFSWLQKHLLLLVSNANCRRAFQNEQKWIETQG